MHAFVRPLEHTEVLEKLRTIHPTGFNNVIVEEDSDSVRSASFVEPDMATAVPIVEYLQAVQLASLVVALLRDPVVGVDAADDSARNTCLLVSHACPNAVTALGTPRLETHILVEERLLGLNPRAFRLFLDS